jgi:hypothetical protein
MHERMKHGVPTCLGRIANQSLEARPITSRKSFTAETGAAIGQQWSSMTAAGRQIARRRSARKIVIRPISQESPSFGDPPIKVVDFSSKLTCTLIIVLDHVRIASKTLGSGVGLRLRTAALADGKSARSLKPGPDLVRRRRSNHLILNRSERLRCS